MRAGCVFNLVYSDVQSSAREVSEPLLNQPSLVADAVRFIIVVHFL